MKLNGRVGGGGERIFEEASEIRVNDTGGDFAYDGFDGVGVEGSTARFRTLKGEPEGPFGEGLTRETCG